MPACVGFLEGGQAMGRVSVLCLAGRAAAWLPSHWQLPGILSAAPADAASLVASPQL